MKNSAGSLAHAVLLLSVIAFGLLASPRSQAQQQSGDKPLGDVAREENAKQKKKAAQQYTLTDENKAPSSKPGAAAESTASSSQPETASQEQGAAAKASSEAPPEQTSSQPHRNALDRRKKSKPEYIIVPAGTEIKVDRSELKTTWPVRIGFNTPIPALSKVTVEDYGQIEKWGSYYEVLALKSITIDKVTYEVDAVTEVPAGGAVMEVTFLLNKSLKIPR